MTRSSSTSAASLLGGSTTATAGMLKTVRRAASVFQRKPSLRHCGANIMTSVLRPKLVYPLAFSKTPASVVCGWRTRRGVWGGLAQLALRGY